jgi:hypothetical protein
MSAPTPALDTAQRVSLNLEAYSQNTHSHENTGSQVLCSKDGLHPLDLELDQRSQKLKQ